MAEIDEVLWQETKENLMDVFPDQDAVMDALYDMKETGFFDIPDSDRAVEFDDDYDY